MRRGICNRCHAVTMVNLSTRGNKLKNVPPGEYCAVCWDEIPLSEDRGSPAHPVNGRRSAESSPSAENAVRQLEGE